MKKVGLLLIIFNLLFGCGADKETIVEQTLESVENFLTLGQCESAISKIGSIDPQDENARYAKLRASAYACRAGYSTITFFTDDLPNIDAGHLLSSLATFSLSSDFDGSGNTNYDDLQTAIESLAYAGGIAKSTNPTYAKRALVFDDTERAEINTYLLYLTLVQLGKYIYYYGSSDATGVKGAGGQAKPCFFPYAADATLAAILASTGGSCNNVGLQGHPDLVDGSDIETSLACEGVVLFNLFKDALANVATGAIDGFDATAITTALNTALAAVTFNDSSITSLTSQTKCEADFADAQGNADLQKFFGYLFEVLHNKT